MAVLEAVRGWEQIAGLPHINDVKKDEDQGGEELLPFDDQSNISDEEVERKIDSILKTNRVSLLMEHDKYVDQPQTSRELLSLASFFFFSLIDTLFSLEPLFLYLPFFRSGFWLHSRVCHSHPRS